MSRFKLPRRGFLSALGAAGASAAWGQAARPAPESDFLLEPGLAYLNTGALGPTSRPVLDRVAEVSRTLESNPAAQGYGPLQQEMETVRAAAARFLGCEAADIVLTDSTTSGMNGVADGLKLEPGDRILTSNLEHPGGRVCWNHVARRHGAVIEEVTIPPQTFDAADIVQRFAAKLTPRTRVVSLSHVTFLTGQVMPIAQLAKAIAGSNTLLVVDGAQSAGSIPVDVRALGCHAYLTSGHKWLMGPKGTGLMYLAKESAGRIEPIIAEDGRAAYTESTGIRNIPAILGLGAAFGYYNRRGRQIIERHALGLRNHAYAALAKLPALKIMSPPPGDAASPLVSFRLADQVDNRALQAKLRKQYRLDVRVIAREQFNGLRVSTHIFNTEEEVGRLVAALRKEL